MPAPKSRLLGMPSAVAATSTRIFSTIGKRSWEVLFRHPPLLRPPRPPALQKEGDRGHKHKLGCEYKYEYTYKQEPKKKATLHARRSSSTSTVQEDSITAAALACCPPELFFCAAAALPPRPPRPRPRLSHQEARGKRKTKKRLGTRKALLARRYRHR
eukprot:scaffold859_cov306-Pinguiococcus_pyrenoidosus.AAC.4